MKEFVMYQNENIIWWANFINDELILEAIVSKVYDFKVKFDLLKSCR